MSNKVLTLIGLAARVGLDVLSFEILDDEWQFGYWVKYHSLKKSGPPPNENYCRDYQDYEIRLKAWKKDGIIQSECYDTWTAMIDGETRRLKKEIKKLYG